VATNRHSSADVGGQSGQLHCRVVDRDDYDLRPVARAEHQIEGRNAHPTRPSAIGTSRCGLSVHEEHSRSPASSRSMYSICRMSARGAVQSRILPRTICGRRQWGTWGRSGNWKPTHHSLASGDGSRITTAVSADRRAA
jgi:hypothetical protein